MIITKLMGGLGNQMFQYAMAKNYAIKNDLLLQIDTSFLDNKNKGSEFVYRDYELDLLSVDDSRWQSGDNCTTIREPHFHYSNQPYHRAKQLLTTNPEENIMFEGYWQTPKYFHEHAESIRGLFKHKSRIENKKGIFKEMVNNIDSCESVMINIRRTDYLNNNFHGVMSVDYVDYAVEILKSSLSKLRFFVFSDDMCWCKKNIKLENCIFVDHKYAGDQFEYYLQLMKRCKHHIIPNSTFAWWAAWLSDNPDQHVVAPQKWFQDPSIDTNDLIPPNWVRI
jgi:hypothetical protein